MLPHLLMPRARRPLMHRVPKSEFQSFHEHAPTYFAFVSRTSWTQLPSALVKILGAIVVEYRSPDSQKTTAYLLVQENLFYGKNVARMCDLKVTDHLAPHLSNISPLRPFYPLSPSL